MIRAFRMRSVKSNYYYSRIAQLHAVSLLCQTSVFYGDSKRAYPPFCNECLNTLKEIRIPPEELFVECKFQSQTIDCLKSVREIIVDYTLCYTFNGFYPYRKDSTDDVEKKAEQDWNIDDGYKTPGTLDMYPRRAIGAGRQSGLSALLRMSKHDFDYKCSKYPGFFVLKKSPKPFIEI
jgi:Amiloride-sensitive sodium channel